MLTHTRNLHASVVAPLIGPALLFSFRLGEADCGLVRESGQAVPVPLRWLSRQPLTTMTIGVLVARARGRIAPTLKKGGGKLSIDRPA
jgi:hypothetical protein